MKNCTPKHLCYIVLGFIVLCSAYSFFLRDIDSEYYLENTLIIPNPETGSPPSSPVITLVSPIFSTDGNVTIEWDPVPYADNYTVCRSALYFTCTPIATVTDTIFHEILNRDLIYYYMVEANNESGYSPPSNAVYVVIDLPEPDAPELDPITPNPNLDGNVQLNWNDVADVNYYNIYRGTTPILNVSTETPIANSTYSHYEDLGLDRGIYYYVITAVGNGGESIASNGQTVNVKIRKIPGFSIWILLGIVAASVVKFIFKLKKKGKRKSNNRETEPRTPCSLGQLSVLLNPHSSVIPLYICENSEKGMKNILYHFPDVD